MSFDFSSLGAYFQIVAINVVLSGDNIVVIGMAAAALNGRQRPLAIGIGIFVATAIRIAFAAVATQLLAITGLLLAGGLLLLWVCWKMYSELRVSHAVVLAPPTARMAGDVAPVREKTLRQAVIQIIIADVSMSLDNVLAVAGAARQNMTALIFGLSLSVILMGVAASLIAQLLNRYRWIGWVGLAIIAYVAAGMIYAGTDQVSGNRLPDIPFLGN